MSSLRRTISSRANGALSKGPITPAGKARSAQNATRHGLMAKCVVLDRESREAFDYMQSEFVARFQPADGVELGLVEEMLSAFWRQRRAWAIETRLMDNAISAQPLDEDGLTRLANGFTSLAGQPPLELIHRYETRLHRLFQRALANLIKMRSLPELTPPENSELPNDPSPISEQSPEPPPAENIRLPNEPSPISAQLAVSRNLRGHPGPPPGHKHRTTKRT